MWTDDLTVGISEIDSQHKELFAQLERLLEACMAGREREEVLGMLDFLDGYVETHFGTEERLHREHGYPGREKHLAEHAFMRERLGHFREEAETAGPTRDLVLRVNQTLIEWLRTHISSADREAGEFLLKRMAPPAD